MQTKEEIAHDVKEQLTKSMSSFGFMIIQTLVTDIEPDMKVRAAMNEINAAQRMRCLLSACSQPFTTEACNYIKSQSLKGCQQLDPLKTAGIACRCRTFDCTLARTAWHWVASVLSRGHGTQLMGA